MEKHIREHGHHLYHLRDAKQIKIAILLLERIMKDEYHENVFKYHREKWGDPDFNWIDIPDQPDFVELKITRPKVLTKKDKEQERKEFRRLSEKEAKQKKQDIDFLFNHMRKHIQGWWD
jgi:predicted O-linked N-acetylglucosamine transferase (SPINDLY family)